MSTGSFYSRFGKSLFDRTAAAAGLLALSPLLAGVAVAVRVNLGSPVIFRQNRPGKNGEMFQLLKFRTMSDRRDAAGELLPDHERRTAFGDLLRSSSLDELPELWNVLRGEMSLVGPRPLLERYLPLYSERQRRRHDIKPGITGWAQINGRNAISWGEKFELDVWYVDNLSLTLDLQIIVKTILTVIRREGIDTSAGTTMAFFDGSN